MSTASLADQERSELCDLMLEVGPGASTLNEGWDVLDLAAHLVVREHDLWAAGGIIWGGPFGAALRLATNRRRRQGLEALVARIRAGAPLWWRPVPDGSQLFEYYIHHEDVRRPNGGGPRTDRPDLDQKLERMLTRSAPLMLRRIAAGVELNTGGERILEHGPQPRATLTGPPGELLLYLSGRRSAAQVELAGDPEACAALATGPLGL